MKSILCDPGHTDFHTHTYFSFDALDNPSSPEAMCEAALNAGLTGIALTDHLEVNSEIESLYAPFHAQERNAACRAAKKKYKDRLNVYVGIELGQPTQYPDAAEKMLKEGQYETVICSLHNMRGFEDFALMDFSGFTEEKYVSLWKRYLSEYLELTYFGKPDIYAHLTYPLRYYKKHGFELNTSEWSELICPILERIIATGACLEVNTSGYRQGLGCPMPDADIIRMYKNLGGEKLTLGSDAHFPSHVGAGIAEGVKLVSSIYGNKE